MSKRLLVVLACLVALSSFAQGRVLSADQFTQALADALRKAQPSLGVTVKRELQLDIRNTGGTGGTVFLDNALPQAFMPGDT